MRWTRDDRERTIALSLERSMDAGGFFGFEGLKWFLGVMDEARRREKMFWKRLILEILEKGDTILKFKNEDFFLILFKWSFIGEIATRI